MIDIDLYDSGVGWITMPHVHLYFYTNIYSLHSSNDILTTTIGVCHLHYPCPVSLGFRLAPYIQTTSEQYKK